MFLFDELIQRVITPQRPQKWDRDPILDKVLPRRTIFALARVTIARAYAVQGDTTAAKDAYQDSSTLWKGADRNFPILLNLIFL